MLISYVYRVVNKCYTSRIPEIFLTSHKVQIYMYIYIHVHVYIIAPIYMSVQLLFVFLE